MCSDTTTHLSEAESWTRFLKLCSGPGFGSSSGGVSTQQNPSFSGGDTNPSQNSTTGVGSSAGVGFSSGIGYRAEAHGTSDPRTPNTRTSLLETLHRSADPPSSSFVHSGTTAQQNKTQSLVRPGTREIQLEPDYTHLRRQTSPTSSQGNERTLLKTLGSFDSSKFWSRFMSSAGNQSLFVVRTDRPAAPAVVNPQSQNHGSRPSAGFPTLQNRAAASPTSRAQSEYRWQEKVKKVTDQYLISRVCICLAVRSVCEILPGVCGRGRCVDLPGGKHTCVCEKGYQHNTVYTYCQGKYTHTLFSWFCWFY